MNNYIKNTNKAPKKIPGRLEKLSPRNKWAIIRDVRKSRKSVSLIQLPGDINVSHWTIWRTLKKCPNVEYSKGQKAPSWKEHHTKARFCWAKKYISFREKWSDVVFIGEKKWNLRKFHFFSSVNTTSLLFFSICCTMYAIILLNELNLVSLGPSLLSLFLNTIYV